MDKLGSIGPDILSNPIDSRIGSGFFLDVDNFLLWKGAALSSLNNGMILTVVLEDVAVDPGVSSKVIGRPKTEHSIFSDADLWFRFFLAHSTTGQTLDLDFNYVVINDGDNVDTKALGVTQTETPVTPAVAYDEFYVDYTIPKTEMSGYFYVSFRFTRHNGVDTGDLHLVKVGVFQIG